MTIATELAPRAQLSLAELTVAWLWSYRESGETRDAYERDLRQFVAWATGRSLELTTMTRVQVDGFLAWLSVQPGRGGRPLSSASVARKLSAVSSWYGYLVDAGAAVANPCARVRRPKVDRDVSKTVGLTAVEAIRIREASKSDPVLPPACAIALAAFMVEIGARVSEICAIEIDDFGIDTGHRTVELRMKGGKTRMRAVPPTLFALLAELIGERTSGPVFLAHDGRPINRHDVKRFVKRVAHAAQLSNWQRISPHSFRHAWATISRLAGATLEDRQYALGHADPRTTQRYDRAKLALARDPSYLVASATAS